MVDVVGANMAGGFLTARDTPLAEAMTPQPKPRKRRTQAVGYGFMEGGYFILFKTKRAAEKAAAARSPWVNVVTLLSALDYAAFLRNGQ